MMDKTIIKPLEQKIIKLYAYTLPQVPTHEGYIKIGDTTREVESRIKEQTNTAGLTPNILWDRKAQKSNGKWFRDKDFHRFLLLNEITKENFGTSANEWFYFNGYPEKAGQLADQYIQSDYSNVQVVEEYIDYKLRDEQALAVQQTLEYYYNKDNEREFLWNAKPRFGKTLTAYDFMLQIEAINTLIVTNRPTIANSWFEDFVKFIAHKDTNLKFISETDTLKGKALTRDQFKEYIHTSPENQRQITFISLQDLKGALFAGGSYDKLEWVSKLKWDLLIIDEAHEGVDTFKTDRAFDVINREFTLHLSGTPFKALANNKFTQDQIYNWSYVDEQQAKRQWEKNNTDSNPYEALPELSLFTYQMSQMIEEQVEQGLQINAENNFDFAFDLNEFFKTKENGDFEYENEVIKFLDNLSSGKFPFSEEYYKKDLDHTFWLLPRVASAKRLEILLNNHPIFKEYHTILAAGDGVSLSDNELEELNQDAKANQKSYDRVKAAISKYSKTITLSVGQLTTGVTIPEWSAVLMLNNIKSPSLYFQAAFRAQNPYEYTKDGKLYRKERAYIFDFAPERTLELYDQFAVNLIGNPSNLTNEERRERIDTLLNFFPVIGEDSDGSMKELVTEDVLTIPVRIKSSEVIKRGFMSNLLFKNISNIFNAPQEIYEILNKISPEKNKRLQDQRNISQLNPLVNDQGEVKVPIEIVINKTNDLFGDKIIDTNRFSESPEINNIVRQIASSLEQNKTFEKFKNEFGLNKTQTKSVEDDFKKQLSTLIEEDKDILEETLLKIELDSTALFEQLEEELQNNLSRTIDPDEETRLFAGAEEKRIELEGIIQQETQQAKKNFEQSVQIRVNEVAQETVKKQVEKQEENKKRTEENDVRDHLRGFSRTIPAFLMAYGNERTTLANFDSNINPETFEDLTSITLDEFRRLRDGFDYIDDNGNFKHFDGFFDEIVFNSSIKAFFNKKKELADYFDESLTEDIYDYIPPQKTNQIFTPKAVVTFMVDKLAEENPGIFNDPDITFIDLYTKSGLFITELVKRLNSGLKDTIPDEAERIKHILEKQIYAVAPSNIIYNIVKNFIFGTNVPVSKINLFEFDMAHSAIKNSFKEDLDNLMRGEPMKFDVIIGNPPYQEETIGENKTFAPPIYNKFMDESFELASIVELITPARFLFNAGATGKSWNEKMLSDPHLKVIYYEPDSEKVFPGTSIKGGVTVTIRNKELKYGSIGTFTAHKELVSILQKVELLEEETLDKYISGRGAFKLSNKALDDHPEIEFMQSKGHKNDFGSSAFVLFDDLLLTTEPSSTNTVKVVGLDNFKRCYRWISSEYIDGPESFPHYKVFITQASGKGDFGEVMSNPILGRPMEGSTETFLSIGGFDTEFEANSVIKYIKTKFCRALLSILKITQANTRQKWGKVPVQDFTENSEVDWNKSITDIDQQLYSKYCFTEEEIRFIEENVQPME